MKRWLNIAGRRYLVRGNWTLEQLDNQYDSFRRKYPDNKMTFAQWLVNRGKVYVSKGK